MKRKIFSLFLVLCLLFGLMNVSISASGGTSTLADLISAAAPGATITLSGTYAISSKITIDKTITLAGPATITRNAGYTGTLFDVQSDGALTLQSISVDGGAQWHYKEDVWNTLVAGAQNVSYGNYGTPATIATWDELFTLEDTATVASAPLFTVAGTLNMSGCTVQNQFYQSVIKITSNASQPVTVNLSGTAFRHNVGRFYLNGYDKWGEAVWIGEGTIVQARNNGAVNLTLSQNCEISDCFSANTNGGLFQLYYNKQPVSFTISDTTITQNRAINCNGLVLAAYTSDSQSTITMNAGTVVSQNVALQGEDNHLCSMFYPYKNCTFIMNGGTITDNDGHYGGGIYTGANCTLALNAGVISDNRSHGIASPHAGDLVATVDDITIGDVMQIGVMALTTSLKLTASDPVTGDLILYHFSQVLANNGAPLTVYGTVYAYPNQKDMENKGDMLNNIEAPCFIGLASQGRDYLTKRDIRIVTFDCNGGTSDRYSSYQVRVVDGNAVPQQKDPIRPGYLFGGWYQDANCTIPWDFSTPITADRTLYAKWTLPSQPTDPQPSLAGQVGALLPMLTGTIADTGYLDVSPTDWYYDAVMEATRRGWMNGTGWWYFDPDFDTTRGTIMTILARMSGVDTEGSKPWYAVGQRWAMERGVSDGTNPGQPITREQLAAMLYRYAQKFGLNTTVSADLSAFTDADQICDYALPAMRWAVGMGLMNGAANRLRPHDAATRAEAAVVLTRFADLLHLSSF